VTERVYVLPPGSRIGPIAASERQALINGSLVAGVYEKTVDRESAHELLRQRAPDVAAAKPGQGVPAGGAGTVTAEGPGMMGGLKDALFGSTGPRGGHRPGLAQAAASSAVRSIGSALGREIIRGVLGSLLGGSRRR
jgi:hypothetical protein